MAHYFGVRRVGDAILGYAVFGDAFLGPHYSGRHFGDAISENMHRLLLGTCTRTCKGVKYMYRFALAVFSEG